MKNLRKTLLFVAALTFSAGVAAAQGNSLVGINNASGEKRKMCVYNWDDQVGIVPKQCFEMTADEKVIWNRQGDHSRFKVKIFKPGLFDEYLYTRDLPGDTQRIIMGEGKRFGFGRPETTPTAVKYRLRVCNQQYDDKVHFVLGFETNKGRFTEGWWSVAKGKCLEFPVSENLKNKIGLEYGNVPRTYYFARTEGNSPLYWQGTDGANTLCANESMAFNLLRKINSNGSYDTRCDDAGYRTFSFRRLDDPKSNEEMYHLTF